MSSFSNSNGSIDQSKTSTIQTTSSKSEQPYQRRESLVKPTWQNICPGQVPADTLEKLKKMGNSCDIGPNENTNTTGGASISSSGLQSSTDRADVGFDIFGKVISRLIIFRLHFHLLFSINIILNSKNHKYSVAGFNTI